VRNTRSEEKNTILYSGLASKWNILEPINGISLNLLGYSMIFHLWASPRNIHIRIPHVGSRPVRPREGFSSVCCCGCSWRGDRGLAHQKRPAMLSPYPPPRGKVSGVRIACPGSFDRNTASLMVISAMFLIRVDDCSYSTSLAGVSLCKILFPFRALLWESIILLLPPPPPAKRTLLQYYCTPIAQYTPPHRPPLLMPYSISYW